MESRRLLAWKVFAISCVCFLCIYEVQEVAFNDNRHHYRAPQPILSALDVHSISTSESRHDNSHTHFENSEGPQTWITMGLCWSENAQVHGKENFPYKDAVPLSSQLWMKLTPAKVIVQIVYSEPQISTELTEYKKELESYGAVVFLVPTGTEMKCVLKSQLIRLLAYKLPFVREDDIIVTADVDAFIMTKEIYHPLLLPGRQIWLYRYGFTLASGSTFMMPFIGIKASVWRKLLNYDDSMDAPQRGFLGQGLSKMVADYGKKMNFSDNYTWDIDQHILSHSILSSGLCSLPKDNKLWAELNLEPK